MILIYSVILWIIYSSLEGFREARHFYYRVSSTRQDTYNEHAGFAIQRIAAWIPFEYIMYDPTNKLTLLNGMFLGLIFIFIHDGVYYSTYNKLAGNYPLGFWSHTSETSNSWLDRNGLTDVIMRITYFAVGALGLICVNYAKY